MANRPTITADWATNTNYGAGSNPWNGQPNKGAPSAGLIANGWEPVMRPPAEQMNFLLNNIGAWIAYLDGNGGAEAYADGSSGIVDFDGVNTFGFATLSSGVYTLTKSIYPSLMTVRTGIRVQCVGWPIYSQYSILEPNSLVENRGSSNLVSLGGSGAFDGFVLGGGSNGGNGNTGPGGAGGGTAGTSLGGAGGAGGTGNGGGIAGGAGGTTSWNDSNGPHRAFHTAISGHAQGNGALTKCFGGGGGGAGGGDGGIADGRGGGGGGGALVFASKFLQHEGVISTRGGAGGIASGGAGGGGGGGGGPMFIISKAIVGLGTFEVAGGAGGAGAGLGGAGAAGQPGQLCLIAGTSGSNYISTAKDYDGVVAMTDVGSGNGVDYIDIIFPTAFLSTGYKFSFDAFSSAGINVPLTLVQKTMSTMRIQPAAPFVGEITWRAWNVA